MSLIRILMVDPSSARRELLLEALRRDPDCHVAGMAADGVEALREIERIGPDLVTLNLEVTNADGLAALKEIRRRYPRLPVIFLSSLSINGAATTLEALAVGATDYLALPGQFRTRSEGVRAFEADLIPRIKVHCRHLLAARTPSQDGPTAFARRLAEASFAPIGITSRIEVVAIGVSTGGPNALAELFSGFPGNFPVPVLIVQHMPPMFTGMLADRLDQAGGLRFQEGTEGMSVQAGHACLAPGGRHMEVVNQGLHKVVHLHDGPVENSCRPSVDVLFRSIIQCYGGNALGVILTGMGQDGLRGCRLLKEQGGQIVVQDEATSVVWGMPGYVARAGLADSVLPLKFLASEIIRRVSPPSAAPVRQSSAG